MALSEDGYHLAEIIELLGASIRQGGELAHRFSYPRALYCQLTKLDRMVGMGEIKSLVATMIFRHVVNAHDGTVEVVEGEDVMNHVLLLGPPGSGKSTVSELLSKIICAIGLLKVPSAEVLKELDDEGKKESLSGIEGVTIRESMVSLPAPTNGINWGEIRELKERNSSLVRRLTTINSLTREIHNEAARLGSVTNNVHRTLSNVELPALPMLPTEEGNQQDQLLRGLGEVRTALDEIRQRMDHLLVVSHVVDVPEVNDIRVQREVLSTQHSERIEPESDFNPRYIQGTRSELIGRFVGQTAPKVRSLVQKTLGGVLFIDEAYALVNRTASDEPESFSLECINTLCGLMSRYGRYFVCIMAGYYHETIKAMTVNQGITRRLTHVVTLGRYTPEELEIIFRQQLLRLGLVPRMELDLTSFIRKYYHILGTTGAVSNQLASACASVHSGRRFRQICEDVGNEDYKGQIDLEILERGISHVKRNLETMDSAEKPPPEQMYN